jgi:poly(glycerol-phosphate) alpha-glucosyltransferase
LPITVLEAWSHGLPVLMSRACNFPKSFFTRAAYEVTPTHPILAHQLRHFLPLSQARRMEMGARGRLLVRQHFSWPRVGSEMGQVYEWLLGRRTRPSSVVIS